MHKLVILFCILKAFAIASIGEITAISGKAFIIRGNSQILLHQHAQVENKDIIKTMKNSKLQIVFNDKTVISLGQKSVFEIEEYLFSRTKVKAKFNISQGLFKSITGKIGKIAPQNFKLQTLNATIGVRGTTIIGETTRDRDHIICSSGKIIVSNHLGQVAVNMGEKTVVRRGQQPTDVTKISIEQLSKINQVLKSTSVKTVSVKKVIEKNNFTQELDAQDVTIQNDIKEIKVYKKQIDEWKEWDTEDFIDKKEDPISKIETPINLPQLQNLRDKAGQKPTYSGNIAGSTMYPSRENSQGPQISAPDQDNFIKLNFDLGAGTINGDMRFKTDDHKVWSADIKDGTVDQRGQFDFGLANSANALQGSGDGMLSGNTLQNADGSFTLQSQNREDENYIKAFGTFNATKD